MPWTLTISALTRGETTIDVFGSLAFNGDYTAGGDEGGFPFAYGNNSQPFAGLRMESVLHAGQAPLSGRVDLGHGYEGKWVPIAGDVVPALKIYVSSTGAELAAGAYPAALTGATDLQGELRYAKNI